MFILHKNSTKWEAVLHPKPWEKKGMLAGRERGKRRREATYSVIQPTETEQARVKIHIENKDT